MLALSVFLLHEAGGSLGKKEMYLDKDVHPARQDSVKRVGKAGLKIHYLNVPSLKKSIPFGIECSK